MQTIAIKVATYNEQKSSFDYRIQHRFPCHAKGLALAVIAAERMMNIEAHHYAFAEIAINFIDGDKVEAFDDSKMFELIERHRARFSILKECLAIMNERAAA